MRKIISGLFLACVLALTIGCGSTQTAQPYFGKVLIGADRSESSERLNFIVVGRNVFVDKNYDDIPQSNEQLQPGQSIDVAPENSDATFTLAADVALDPELISESLPQRLDIRVDVNSDTHLHMVGKLFLTTQPNETNWLHFGGPLTFFATDELSLRRGSPKPQELKLFLGTIANGSISATAADDEPATTQKSPSWKNRTVVVIPTGESPFPDAKISFEIDGSEPDVLSMPMDQNC